MVCKSKADSQVSMDYQSVETKNALIFRSVQAAAHTEPNPLTIHAFETSQACTVCGQSRRQRNPGI